MKACKPSEAVTVTQQQQQQRQQQRHRHQQQQEQKRIISKPKHNRFIFSENESILHQIITIEEGAQGRKFFKFR